MSKLTPEEKERRRIERANKKAANKERKKKEVEAAKKAQEEQYKKDMLDGTARFMYNVFNKDSGNYNQAFEELLLSGGGGNSMFVNCWAKPSGSVVKTRLSTKAKEKIAELGYATIYEVPHENKHNNAKGAANRIEAKKYFHLDHNPGNVKVLELIREKCRSFDTDPEKYEENITELKNFLLTVQTLDWITVEQDDVRTYGDDSHSKKEKDKMDHQQRDDLLNDIWEDL